MTTSFDLEAYLAPLLGPPGKLENHNIKRAWVTITLPSTTEDPLTVAGAILVAINRNYQLPGASPDSDKSRAGHWSFTSDLRDFAIRADVVDSISLESGSEVVKKIVVPLSGSSVDAIMAMAGLAQSIAGVGDEAVQVDMVTEHLPKNPVRSPAFIANEEENHPPGRKEGYNAWG